MGKDKKWKVVNLDEKLETKPAEKGSYNSKDKDGKKVAQKGTFTEKKTKESGIYDLLDTKEKKEKFDKDLKTAAEKDPKAKALIEEM